MPSGFEFRKNVKKNMKVEISVGELVDKVTILEIKLEKIQKSSKLANIRKEYGILHRSMNEVGIDSGSQDFRKLKEINRELWDIENRIRVKESKHEFDRKFIELARKVYFCNDERAAIKRKINLKYSSAVIEEKEYADYNRS